MLASVLIPTRGRPEMLARCVGRLARQTLDASEFEVLVGLDGADDAARAACEGAWRESGGRESGLRVVELPRQGLIGVRNRLIEHARGELVVSINDDVLPVPGFLAAHCAAHAEPGRADRPAIVVGHSPYVRPAPGSAADTLLNRLARETSLVFFYDVMDTPAGRADRERDWGFRHCFGLNFSAPLDLVRRAGGFQRVACPYGYEDIELAFRLRERFGMPVLFRPEALAEHEHFYRAADIVERERMLGRAAWHFARSSPEFGRAVFGRDITSEEEIGYSREFVARERGEAERLRVSFERLDTIPAGAIGSEHAPALLRSVYEQHLLLKRWTWRVGLLEAADETSSAVFSGECAGGRPRPAIGAPAR